MFCFMGENLFLYWSKDNISNNKRGIKNKRSRIFPTKLIKKLNPKIGIRISMINE